MKKVMMIAAVAATLVACGAVVAVLILVTMSIPW